MSETRKGKAVVISIDDLRTGKRPRVNEKECAYLKGCSTAKLQRDRWLGKGLPFQRDGNGRIWYRAEDVLTDLDLTTHRSTSEYDTGTHLDRLELARARKAERRQESA